MDNIKFTIKEPYPGWLDEFVTTKEAEQLTGVPAETLTTKRSVGGGPSYVNPDQSRIIRYQRRALYDWMFSGGIKTNTADIGKKITLPFPDNDNVEAE